MMNFYSIDNFVCDAKILYVKSRFYTPTNFVVAMMFSSWLNVNLALKCHHDRNKLINHDEFCTH